MVIVLIVAAVIAAAIGDVNDAVVIINLCVPTASGVPLDLLPDAIKGGNWVEAHQVVTMMNQCDASPGSVERMARKMLRSSLLSAVVTRPWRRPRT